LSKHYQGIFTQIVNNKKIKKEGGNKVAFVTDYMNHYGYIVLFFALLLELLALPLPGEVIMSYAGLLIFQGKLNWILSILMAGLGSSIGMTISYWIGYKLGTPFFEKYGHRIHLGPERLKKTSIWFERFGNKFLIIAYFIPGVRHFTGYFSGVTKLPFRTYMRYAYSGAFIWAGTFISLGKILGPKWEKFHHSITKYLLIAGVIAAVIFICIYLYKKYKFQLIEFTQHALNKGVKTFLSFGRVKFVVVIAFGICLSFIALMIGLVQDLFANEFAEFDTVASYIVHAVFTEDWYNWMNLFVYYSSVQVFVVVVGLTWIWVMMKGKDRVLETGFLLFVSIGGVLWAEGLRRIFHRTGPHNTLNTFPSEQTLLTFIVLGFATFLLTRHYFASWTRYVTLMAVALISSLFGISRIYFDMQYPSDIAAGFVFGGVWLSLNIVLLEVFRILRKGKMNFST
jgi:membrane protein DedA with SNARE-associated domain/membrane-associated phospholipid phosphatase